MGIEYKRGCAPRKNSAGSEPAADDHVAGPARVSLRMRTARRIHQTPEFLFQFPGDIFVQQQLEIG